MRTEVLTRSEAAKIAGVLPYSITNAVKKGKLNRYEPKEDECSRKNGLYILNDGAFQDYCLRQDSNNYKNCGIKKQK